MNTDTLINEYKEAGLTIIDFHLGLRLAKPMVINTIMALLIFASYIIFIYSIWMLISNPSDQNITVYGLLGISIIFIAKKLGKFISYIYIFTSLALMMYIVYSSINTTFKIAEIDTFLSHTMFVVAFFSVLVIAIVSTIIVYRTNRNIIIKDGVLSIPASDVEQSIIAYIILKPFWGLFYRRDIMLSDIVSVKNDGYGNNKKDIYPITVTDTKSSNRLIFTSRQKRDEFKTKISIILGLKDTSSSSFGESE